MFIVFQLFQCCSLCLPQTVLLFQLLRWKKYCHRIRSFELTAWQKGYICRKPTVNCQQDLILDDWQEILRPSSKTQKTALKQLKNDKQIKVHPLDKGMINNDISKTQEQSGKLETIDYDPTNLFTGKFQRLKNEDKFN